MVYRIYVEKKEGLAHEAASLLSDARELLGVDRLENVRILNRYDVENIDEALFERCKTTVFSEPQLDDIFDGVNARGGTVFAVEYLPGQFDQRADSAAQCIQLISQGERPDVRSAKVYVLYGNLSVGEIEKIKHYVINPVESREATMDIFDTLKTEYEIPTAVETLTGFIDFDETRLASFVDGYGLAMDLDDIRFCRDYFRSEKRDPTITEIRMIDTYWSDHCRHTTFLTTIDSVQFEDDLLQKSYDKYISVRKELGRTKPVNLMDIATIAVKHLKKAGKLDKLDESEEINACTVKMKIQTDGEDEDWLLLFKNETHNHPTEIEPFGGAATCVGGAIRDPLSGRGYVYQSMRITGAADPTRPVSETLPGKLPQRRIVTEAAAGFSSYGNQIGLATGLVREIYHEGYAAKRMEVGAVIAAAPEANVRREEPIPGDAVILIGGRTGRDGCGGATGASKAHTASSLELCGAEVQKGNAPEERKLQRLFRNPSASRMIKRCNDFGAGGVSVAIGELADGLTVDLDKVPKKYMGLDSTELAISESQERMAVVVAAEDAEAFMALCSGEGIEATLVARVTDDARLTMYFKGRKAVDIPRAFIDTNGAAKHTRIRVAKQQRYEPEEKRGSFRDRMIAVASDLNVCSQRGLAETFDSTVGANTVLMPFGGRKQLTPTQAMAAKFPVPDGNTTTCSVMAYGFDPYISEASPYYGAYTAVVHSLSKLAAAGADMDECWLSFQEYFERMRSETSWGKPMAALMGALDAQRELGAAAIGGKDSMSGSFESIHVPPTLISFAVAVGKVRNITSPEFKKAGNGIWRLSAAKRENGLPEPGAVKALFAMIGEGIREGSFTAVYVPERMGAAEAVIKMGMGNGIGAKLATDDIFRPECGSFIVECGREIQNADGILAEKIGETTASYGFTFGEEEASGDDIAAAYEGRLDGVFPASADGGELIELACADRPYVKPFGVKTSRPTAVIPVFPGTNCEYETERAFRTAGFEVKPVVVRTGSVAGLNDSITDFTAALDASELLFLPGGFSNGDEPDGSGKFIAAFLMSEKCRASVEALLARGGLAGGICNGFQALLRTGLLPSGRFMPMTEDTPSLTHNVIARHMSRIVRVRVETSASPWLRNVRRGEIYSVPISHGEGRFTAPLKVLEGLAANGQIITRYVDTQGDPSMDMAFNPNGSFGAIEGVCSPDGRIFGKMGHSERIGGGLYKNVAGCYDMGLFRSAFDFFN